MHIYAKILFALLFSTATVLQTAQAVPNQDDCRNNDKHPHRERPTFSAIDTNSDGDIDSEEFSAQKLPHGDHQTVFVSIDTDKNGMISKDEYEDHKPPHHNKKQKRGCND